MDTTVRRRRALAIALAALLLPISVASVAAAQPKIVVCHLDQVLLTYSPVTVSATSLAKHLAHGDQLPGEGQLNEACQLVVEPHVFALAFTDVDGDDAYNETTDVLIAKLVDTNGDLAVSVGDTITTGRYPLGFDFETAGFGTFGVTSHTVTSVLFAPIPENIGVTSGDDYFYFYGGSYDSDIYWEFDNITDARVRIQDAQAEFPDYLSAWQTPPPPSAPDTEMEVGPVYPGGGDDPFIDVFIVYP